MKPVSVQLPTYFLMVAISGWLNRQQQAAIDYLTTENEILKSQMRGRLRLKDEDRRRLAEKGRALGRRLLAHGESFLVMDRDSSFHEAFRGLLDEAGVRPVRTPPRSPNCSAHLERFHGSFKREVADRMIFFGERHLQYSIDEFLEYYHGERNHQGLDGWIITH